MTGPFVPGRAAQPVDLLNDGLAGDGWGGINKLFAPHLQEQPLQPADDVAKVMWGFYNTPQGRAMFEWMFDISLRQPLRVTGRTLEETALLSATRQGINGFAEAVLAAIAHGESLVRQSKPQNGAGS